MHIHMVAICHSHGTSLSPVYFKLIHIITILRGFTTSESVSNHVLAGKLIKYWLGGNDGSDMTTKLSFGNWDIAIMVDIL